MEWVKGNFTLTKEILTRIQWTGPASSMVEGGKGLSWSCSMMCAKSCSTTVRVWHDGCDMTGTVFDYKLVVWNLQYLLWMWGVPLSLLPNGAIQDIGNAIVHGGWCFYFCGCCLMAAQWIRRSLSVSLWVNLSHLVYETSPDAEKVSLSLTFSFSYSGWASPIYCWDTNTYRFLESSLFLSLNIHN